MGVADACQHVVGPGFGFLITIFGTMQPPNGHSGRAHITTKLISAVVLV